MKEGLSGCMLNMGKQYYEPGRYIYVQWLYDDSVDAAAAFERKIPLHQRRESYWRAQLRQKALARIALVCWERDGRFRLLMI